VQKFLIAGLSESLSALYLGWGICITILLFESPLSIYLHITGDPVHDPDSTFGFVDQSTYS